MSLKVTNLSKRYGDKWVLRDVSFEAKEGEILGIYGLTGAGKSTLLRVVAGIEQGNGGAVHHDSKDLTALATAERGFCFPRQSAESFWKRLFPNGESLALADGERQSRVLDETLDQASGVVLLDDAFCYMDDLLRQESYRTLQTAVKEKNLTVVAATNDFEEMMTLCDRVVVLQKGEILQTGTPQEIYTSPASAAAAYICGRNNLIEARRLTSSKADIPEFQTIAGAHRLFTNKVEKSKLGAINQNVTLTIRPEHISISFGASFPEDNLLKATVRDVKFQGATTVIELDSNGLILKALVLRLVGLEIRDECMVGLPPDRILVFSR